MAARKTKTTLKSKAVGLAKKPQKKVVRKTLAQSRGIKKAGNQTVSIKERKTNFEFPKSIEKHWLGGSAFNTHLLNTYTLIFPEGEKFFIRSIQKYLKKIDEKKLVLEAQAFMKQEAKHYKEHEKFYDNLRDQGYHIDFLLKVVNKIIYDHLESLFGEKLNLSLTAALEHYTALLSEVGLESGFLETAHPNLKALFEWHAAEEIEHKNVAYDVLQEVDDDYALRIKGMVLATILLWGLSALFTTNFIIQDKLIFNKKVWRDFSGLFFSRERLFFKAFAIFLQYFHPDFHPSQKDNKALSLKALQHLQNLGWVSVS